MFRKRCESGIEYSGMMMQSSHENTVLCLKRRFVSPAEKYVALQCNVLHIYIYTYVHKSHDMFIQKATALHHGLQRNACLRTGLELKCKVHCLYGNYVNSHEIKRMHENLYN